MHLTLKNIGKLALADIDLAGITVIAGENDTGKSTVGKVLCEIFNCFYELEESLADARYESIIRDINQEFKRLPESDLILDTQFLRATLAEQNPSDLDEQTLEKILQASLTSAYGLFRTSRPKAVAEKEVYFSREFVSAALESYKKYLRVPSEVICQSIVTKKIKTEFHSQLNNIHAKDSEGVIILTVKGQELKIVICNNRATNISNIISLHSEALYLEDPFVLDTLSMNFPGLFSQSSFSRQQVLMKRLIQGFYTTTAEEALQEVVVTEQLSEIMKKLNSACSGSLTNSRDGFAYAVGKNSPALSLENISLGLKPFIIIKSLLLNGGLERNGVLVLDEPEIHLHPQWQVLLAEILVLLQKEFNLHILITTHSPYFLEAIEVYSEKHKTAESCRYYLAENSGSNSNIRDVMDNTELIYQKLAQPFQTLETARYDND